MTTSISITHEPLTVTPGVQPSTDATSFDTEHWTFSDKIRFFNGRPRKIGGWESIDFDRLEEISGMARSFYSATINGNIVSLIGTNTHLYSIIGSELTNITPLKTSSVAAANSLDTLYTTLANNPLTTTNGSKSIVIADTSAARFKTGDTYTLAGAATTNGIPNTDINIAQVIRAIGTNTITIQVATAATSSGTGGGASVVRKTGMIRLAKAAHGLSDGDRVKISGAATTGGVTDAQINLEFIIRNVASGTFDFMTAGTATSSVSAGGGASTVYYPPIDAGAANEGQGQGYGMGKYGVGLYGTDLTSTTSRTPVRLWFFDKFGENIICTPGDQGKGYEWAVNLAVAPVAVANAPAAINYAFVSDNVLMTLGAATVNRLFGSAQGDRTDWTLSSTTNVYDDNIEGAARFLSHLNVNGTNLIFTNQQVYTLRFIGLPANWEIKLKDPTAGLIAPMARVVVGGIGFWMGQENLYMWRGGNVEIIPANSQNQSTLLNYVFSNINRSQKSKFFAWHNEKFNEVWFHYCSEDSNEPDRIVRVNVRDFVWTPDTMDRTCAEYPTALLQYPRLIDSAGTVFKHEKGVDDNGAAMEWTLTGPLVTMDGKKNKLITAAIPDNTHTGNISFTISSKQFPQSTAVDKTETITPTTERVPMAKCAKFWQYTLTGNTIGQKFIMGKWLEEIQEAGGN